jgi:hypothetical protein
VTNIGDQAFSGCNSLTAIQVENGNVNYSSEAGILFNKDKTTLICCPGGKTGHYTIPDSVTSIEDRAFSGCRRLTSITLPDGVTSIGDWAFDDCRRLTSITIPDGVTRIGEQTFYKCRSLTSITIPNGVTRIGHCAFSDCSRLTSITIPNSVTSIGWGAFYGCTRLTSFTNLNPTPQDISHAFNINLSKMTLYVPAGVIAAYRAAAVWKDFGTITAHVP